MEKRVSRPKTSHGRKGFTLIELMVTVAIIAILVAIGTVMFARAQKTARDGVRRAELKNLQTALEIYKTEKGNYPSTRGNLWSESSYWGFARERCGANGYIPNLCSDYILTLPRDPLYAPDPGYNAYLYRSDGNNYKLWAHNTVETLNPVPPSDPMYDYGCTGINTCPNEGGPRCSSFVIFSAGGKCW